MAEESAKERKDVNKWSPELCKSCWLKEVTSFEGLACLEPDPFENVRPPLKTQGNSGTLDEKSAQDIRRAAAQKHRLWFSLYEDLLRESDEYWDEEKNDDRRERRHQESLKLSVSKGNYFRRAYAGICIEASRISECIQRIISDKVDAQLEKHREACLGETKAYCRDSKMDLKVELSDVKTSVESLGKELAGIVRRFDDVDRATAGMKTLKETLSSVDRDWREKTEELRRSVENIQYESKKHADIYLRGIRDNWMQKGENLCIELKRAFDEKAANIPVPSLGLTIEHVNDFVEQERARRKEECNGLRDLIHNRLNMFYDRTGVERYVSTQLSKMDSKWSELEKDVKAVRSGTMSSGTAREIFARKELEGDWSHFKDSFNRFKTEKLGELKQLQMRNEAADKRVAALDRKMETLPDLDTALSSIKGNLAEIIAKQFASDKELETLREVSSFRSRLRSATGSDHVSSLDEAHLEMWMKDEMAAREEFEKRINGSLQQSQSDREHIREDVKGLVMAVSVLTSPESQMEKDRSEQSKLKREVEALSSSVQELTRARETREALGIGLQKSSENQLFELIDQVKSTEQQARERLENHVHWCLRQVEDKIAPTET